ncbi:hypothetical protein Nm8I071_61850 [Nonomuraea sp. TT08I-71]|nr:hypothetical protein Nm8I071_61850 [Nonomuraea sp. TT08I-71]
MPARGRQQAGAGPERPGVLVAARQLGHVDASVTTRHYARAVDGRDAEIAQHLDASRAEVARRSGTQRARKPHEAEQ